MDSVGELDAIYIFLDPDANDIRLRRLIRENKLRVLLTEDQCLDSILATSRTSLRIIVADGIFHSPRSIPLMVPERQEGQTPLAGKRIVIRLTGDSGTLLSPAINAVAFTDFYKRLTGTGGPCAAARRTGPSPGISVSFDIFVTTPIGSESLALVEASGHETKTHGALWHHITCVRVKSELLLELIGHVPERRFAGLPIDVEFNSELTSAEFLKHLKVFGGPWADRPLSPP